MKQYKWEQELINEVLPVESRRPMVGVAVDFADSDGCTEVNACSLPPCGCCYDEELVPHCLVNMSKSMLITHCHFSVICWKHCFEFLENTWSEVDTATTLHLRGTVQQHELLILIYSGSSHIFISDKWQPRLLGVQPLDHRLAVKVANGQSVSCPHHLPDVGWFISDYQFHHLPDAEWFISSYKFVNDLVFLQLPLVYVIVVREVLLRSSDTKQVQDNGLTQQLRSSNDDLKYAVKDSFHNNNQFLVSISSNEQASLSQSAWHLPNNYLMVPMSAHQKKVVPSSLPSCATVHPKKSITPSLVAKLLGLDGLASREGRWRSRQRVHQETCSIPRGPSRRGYCDSYSDRSLVQILRCLSQKNCHESNLVSKRILPVQRRASSPLHVLPERFKRWMSSLKLKLRSSTHLKKLILHHGRLEGKPHFKE
jgi:hypothetical protein